MTDNEKRAHDLALFSAQTKIIALINDCNKTNRKLSYDFYSLYKESYTVALDLINKDFPDSLNNQ